MDTTNRSTVPRWLTERAVANLLSCSVSVLQKNRIKNKGLPYVKFGKSVRYFEGDILAFMENQKVMPSGGNGSVPRA